MLEQDYTLKVGDILNYGISAALVLTWLRKFPHCGNHILVSPSDIQRLDLLLSGGGLNELKEIEILGLIAIHQTEAGYSIEVLSHKREINPDSARELKQHGLTPETIDRAYEAFTVGVHHDQTTIMAEYYRALPLASLGIQKSFIRFAIHYNAVYRESSAQQSQFLQWVPQIKTLQILASEGIPKTFIHEKKIEFVELAHGSSSDIQQPSIDHSFIEFCRKAWTRTDEKRRHLERQLSA